MSTRLYKNRSNIINVFSLVLMLSLYDCYTVTADTLTFQDGIKDTDIHSTAGHYEQKVSSGAAKHENVELKKVVICNSSSIDNTFPLKSIVVFKPDSKLKPIMLVMHSYAGDKSQQVSRGEYFARKGFVAIMPDMRGRDDSAGERDDGGVEIMDIYDAYVETCKKYPSEADPDNVNIVGFSGGGGNVFSVVTKFPDLINVAGAYFGISDYGYWSRVNKHFAILHLGGGENEKSDRELARNSLNAVQNNPLTYIHMFWDEKEYICPGYFNTEYNRRAKKMGYTNTFLHCSKEHDKFRYIHGKMSWPTFINSLTFIIPQAKIKRNLKLNKTGKLIVPGFVKTRQFEIFLGKGNNAVAEVTYDISGNIWKFEFSRKSSHKDIRGWLAVKSKYDTSRIKIRENGKIFVNSSYDGGILKLKNIRLDSKYTIEFPKE